MMAAMTFKQAVEKTELLDGAYRPGLQALRAEDKPHIHPEDPRRLTGSIDLVFCHAVNGSLPRWFVVDYKSNRLDPRGERRYPVQHFCREGMRYAMERAHYYLQYHLYLLALHRYLKWRMGDEYSYERHIGGVYYLFFRGLLGPDKTPLEGEYRHGAFFDRPPVEVIDALDQLFRNPAAAANGGAG